MRSESVTAVPRIWRGDDAARVPALIVLGGVDHVVCAAERRVVTFTHELEIGRHRAEDSGTVTPRWIVADRLVSGHHAAIRQAGRDFELTDLDSTNGTVVDGMMAEPKLKLRDGSVIFVGGIAAVFRLVSTRDLDHILAELTDPLAPVPSCNPELARLCSRIRRLAETDGELLLTGETGVGKEVYAHAVHKASGRKGRFVAINCAALPRELVESELFGYARGAHSQASAAKAGIIEEAEGGTLFLDEIGEMAPDLQTKLLRFTQDRLLMPIGGTRSRRVDVRILAATSRTSPPSEAGSAGLRQDLAARLGAEPLRIPSLRERREDLGAFIRHFLGPDPKPLDLPAFHAICLYPWPGNVRELQKVLATAVALARGQEKIRLEHLPQVLTSGTVRVRRGPAGRVDRRASPTAVELEDLLRLHEGNMMKIARELDRKPAVVYRWAKRFQLDVASYRKRGS